MLFGPERADFESLRQCFRQLAERGENFSIELALMNFVHAAGGMKVRLISCTSENDLPQVGRGLGIRRVHASHPIFEWRKTQSEWQYLAEFLEDFLESDTPCHQYLSAYPDEDAIVVVSKGEYPDTVLDQ
jgi:hypothetical protein